MSERQLLSFVERLQSARFDCYQPSVLISHFIPTGAGEGNSKLLQYFCLENPMNSTKRQKDRTLKDELHRSIDAQNTTGEDLRNNYRKNEETEPK